MAVPSYQMHKVLAFYAQRLEHSAAIRRQSAAGRINLPEEIEPADKSRRQSVIDRVAASIFERISGSGSCNEIDREVVGPFKTKRLEQSADRPVWDSEFRFNRIDAGDQKRSDCLMVGDEGFVRKHLEQLVREGADHRIESSLRAEDDGDG